MQQVIEPILDFYQVWIDNIQSIPVFSSISAGFPSCVDDFYEQIDLNEWIIKNPASTFFVRVQGNSMVNAGIRSNDILVIDKSITAKHRDIAVVAHNYEFTVRRIIIENEQIYLEATNPYNLTLINEKSHFKIWGVITHVIHKTI